MDARTVVASPVFDRLRAFLEEFGRYSIRGLDLRDPPETEFYPVTPVNCLTFACTGGEGVHFSFLVESGRIDDDSPIVMTVPAAQGESYFVGENLYDFLCLGCAHGFFALEQLAYEPALTLRAYTDPPSTPSKRFESSLDDHAKGVLRCLRERFDLAPWTRPERFAALQDLYRDRLELSEDYIWLRDYEP